MRLVQTAGTLGMNRGDLMERRIPVISERALFRGIVEPAPPPLEIHAFSVPAGAFTGDFYFIERRADGVWFAVGDVAGKGLDSAIFMKMVHEELDYRVTREDLSVTCLVSCIHDLLSEELPGNKFVSLVAGHLTPDGHLEMVNAGHTPPIITRLNGSTDILDSTGPVAGILPGARWCSRDLRLEPGEALILYSDGVTEARSRSGEDLDVKGLEEIVRMIPRSSPREIVNGIRAAVESHRDGDPAEDDLTIVTIMRTKGH